LQRLARNFLVARLLLPPPQLWKLLILVAATSTTLTMTAEFELGKAFDESTPDGRSVTTTYTKEGNNKWITTQKNKKAGRPDVIVIREFTDAGINIDYTCDGVVSKQLF
jgi:hypothetical protein